MDQDTARRVEEAEAASDRGDTILVDPQELWLQQFRDRTLLVLAVISHGHGLTRRQIRHSVGHLPGAVEMSLRSLRRAGLVRREGAPGGALWFATRKGNRLGVTPYVTRLLGSARVLFPGDRYGGWSVGRFGDVGSEKGPPLFRPSVALAGLNTVEQLADVIRTGIRADRAFAVTKLIALENPASAPVLAEVAQRHGDDEPLAREATIALGSFSGQAATRTLLELAEHRDSFMREAAARALGHKRATEGVPALGKLLRYDSVPVRIAAVHALARIDAEGSVAAVAPALCDRDRQVCAAARRALIELKATAALSSNRCRSAPLRAIDTVRSRLRRPARRFGS